MVNRQRGGKSYTHENVETFVTITLGSPEHIPTLYLLSTHLTAVIFSIHRYTVLVKYLKPFGHISSNFDKEDLIIIDWLVWSLANYQRRALANSNHLDLYNQCKSLKGNNIIQKYEKGNGPKVSISSNVDKIGL